MHPGSLDGIILINKPPGITSFAVIARLRRLLGIRRIGHAGTLDPFADGLLTVCIGKATQVVRYMESYAKTYRVSIAMGLATNTQDATGSPVMTHTLSEAARELLLRTDFAAIRQAAADLAGEQIQVPPMYSAVKVGGKPLYVYARRGETIERSGRTIQVYAVTVESCQLAEHIRLTLCITCSKGTYIRTLADTLGQRLGYGAHAVNLTRLASGPYRLEDAWDLEALFQHKDACSDQAAFIGFLAEAGVLLPTATALAGLRRLDIEQDQALRLICGQIVWLRSSKDIQPGPDRLAVWCLDRLVAVACLDKGPADDVRIRTERVLINGADLQSALSDS